MTETPRNAENTPAIAIDESQARNAWVKPEVVKLDLETAQQTGGIPG